MTNWRAVAQSYGWQSDDPIRDLAVQAAQQQATGTAPAEVTVSAKLTGGQFFCSVKLTCPQTSAHIDMATECALRQAWDTVTLAAREAGLEQPPPLPQGRLPR